MLKKLILLIILLVITSCKSSENLPIHQRKQKIESIYDSDIHKIEKKKRLAGRKIKKMQYKNKKYYRKFFRKIDN